MAICFRVRSICHHTFLNQNFFNSKMYFVISNLVKYLALISANFGAFSKTQKTYFFLHYSMIRARKQVWMPYFILEVI